MKLVENGKVKSRAVSSRRCLKDVCCARAGDDPMAFPYLATGSSNCHARPLFRTQPAPDRLHILWADSARQDFPFTSP